MGIIIDAIQGNRAQVLANPQTVTLGATPNSGNLLVVNVENSTSGGVVTIANMTQITTNVPGSGARTQFLQSGMVVPGQSATISALDSGSPTTNNIQVAEFAGVTNVQDTTAVISSSGASSVTTLAMSSITTTTPNTLLIAFWGVSGTSTSANTVIDNGFTLVSGAAGNCSAIAYKIVTSAGTYSATWSWLASTRAVAGLVAFRAKPLNKGLQFVL